MENIKHGKAIFKMTCPAPLAATAGKMSALVMTNPLAVHITLGNESVESAVLVCCDIQSQKGAKGGPNERASGKHR